MVFKTTPILFEKIWGGKELKKTYNSNLNNIGEVWGISGYKKKSNIVNNSNQTLRDLFREQKHLFGNYPNREFPILMKIIDAEDNLSIQVHPNDSYALKYKSKGKEECWYVLDTEPDSKILIGHNAINEVEFKNRFYDKKYMELFNCYSVKKGDYFYIPSGTVHAILKNTLIFEISQSSDLTFRLFDYDRKYKNGMKRELHIKEALEMVKIPDSNLVKKHINKFFSFEVLNNLKEDIKKAHLYGDYLGIIEGEGLINNIHLKFGDFFMVSSNDSYTLRGEFKYIRITLIAN